MATVGAGRDVHEVAELDRFDAVPDSAWHDVRVAGAQEHPRLDADRLRVTVVEDQFHRSAHDIEELVTIRVNLPTVWSWPLEVGNRSDRVSVDSPRRSRRGGSDGHRPVASDVRDASREADRRRAHLTSHTYTLPDREEHRRVQRIGGGASPR